jgi:hypothetical protein
MHRVAAKFLPTILTAEQNQQRGDLCTEYRQLVSDDETFLSFLIWHPVTFSYLQK